MRAILRLEAIGDDTAFITKRRPWVARLTGLDDQYTFKREFIQGQKDYSQGNSVGSRGVYLYYALPDGVYEVNAPVSWKRDDRYFCYVEDTVITRMTKDEAMAWLKSECSVSTS